jgi:hypothetical protein
VIHNFYGVGYDPLGGQREAALVLGIGGRVQLAESVHLDVDLLTAWLHDDYRVDDGREPVRLLNTARALVGVEVARGISLVGGISYNVRVDHTPGEIGCDLCAPIRPFEEDSTEVSHWPGLQAGVQIF